MPGNMADAFATYLVIASDWRFSSAEDKISHNVNTSLRKPNAGRPRFVFVALDPLLSF